MFFCIFHRNAIRIATRSHRCTDSQFGSSLVSTVCTAADGNAYAGRSRSQLQSEKFIMESVKINCRYKYISDAAHAEFIYPTRLRFCFGSQSKCVLCLRFIRLHFICSHFIANISSLSPLNMLSFRIEWEKLTNWHFVECLSSRRN